MKANNTNVRKSVADLMARDIASARKHYFGAKDKIIWAMAHGSRIYRTAETHSNAALMIDNEIDARNSKVDGHNNTRKTAESAR